MLEPGEVPPQQALYAAAVASGLRVTPADDLKRLPIASFLGFGGSGFRV